VGVHLAFERYCWFDSRIRKGLFPNAASLAEEFEISLKTARRNIAFMRDMLDAPLEYDPRRKGYRYSDSSFALPGLWISQEEVLAVLIAKKLLSCCAGGILSAAIGKMGRKIAAQTEKIGLTEKRLEEAFSAAWLGYSPTQADTFRIAARGLLENRLLAFTYSSPFSGTTTSRRVEPHHLQHYMGNWVLLAWCREREAWRKFLLARMTNLTAEGTVFTPRPREEWAIELEGAFGIFQGQEKTSVKLRFSPRLARWVREQFWHSGQVMEDGPGGSLLLTIPVADFREVKLKILQFGAECEVLEPEALRLDVKEEIERAAWIYRER